MNRNPPPTPEKASARQPQAQVLDADVLHALLSAHAPAADSTANQALLQRVGQRLRSAMAQPTVPPAASGVHTVQANEGTWKPFLTGIERKNLHRDGVMASFLLRMQAGAVLPGHRHGANEDCVVLQGRIRVGEHLRVDEGGFHHVLMGTDHPAITAEVETLVYIRGMVEAH